MQKIVHCTAAAASPTEYCCLLIVGLHHASNNVTAVRIHVLHSFTIKQAELYVYIHSVYSVCITHTK